MKKSTLALSAALAVVLGFSVAAHAAGVFYTGRVTSIDMTSFPDHFNFQVDTGSPPTPFNAPADCPAGSFLMWHSTNVDTVKAAYAAVLASYLTGKPMGLSFDQSTVKAGLQQINSGCFAAGDCCLLTRIGLVPATP
jgi:hypothetical protein